MWQKMLRRENEIRLSKEAQKDFQIAEQSADRDWLHVAANIQTRVFKEFEMEPTRENLLKYRRTALENPDLVHYVKFNRARKGLLEIGDIAPNVQVVKTGPVGGRCHLIDEYQEANKPLVVLAGSWS